MDLETDAEKCFVGNKVLLTDVMTTKLLLTGPILVSNWLLLDVYR